MTLQPMLALAWNPAVGLPLLIIGIIVLALIWLFGGPKKEQQGRRRPEAGQGAHGTGTQRVEPTLGGNAEPQPGDALSFSATDDIDLDGAPHEATPQGELDVGMREELERLGSTLAGRRTPTTSRSKLAGQAAAIVDALRAPRQVEPTIGDLGGSNLDNGHTPSLFATPAAPVPVNSPTPPVAAVAPAVAAPAAPAPQRMPPRSDLGRRPPQVAVERIVTLFVVAREGACFNGADLVVAAEKAGLEFGDMGIYHRLVDGKREQGPVFSVANMLKPGSFDLGRVDALRTPGLSFFMTLPAPIPALDAWETMLPTAQRLAELLDGQVLDEERNALGRQRIAHIRDELRGWDRDHEGEEIHIGR